MPLRRDKKIATFFIVVVVKSVAMFLSDNNKYLLRSYSSETTQSMYQHAATQQTFQTLSSPGRNACASEHNPGLDRSDSLLFLSSWRASSPDLAEPLAWKEERTWASRCREIFVSRESPLAILMVSMVMMISMPCQPVITSVYS